MNQHTPPPRFAEARLATGVRLRYAEQGAEQGKPAVHPLILLHGYTDSWFSFSHVLPELAASHHTYAPDQRGHGDSDRPETGYAFPDFAADVIAFMDAEGLPRATLVGHSMGSFVAQQVASIAPERVERLVLVGSATAVRNFEGILELGRAVETLGDPVPAEFAREFQASSVYRPLPEGFMDGVVAESLKLPARVWRAAMAGMLAARPARLADIQTPTLILWGDRDAFCPRIEQDSLVSTLGNAVLKVYPETGHAPHWEQPEQFVRDLEDFITHTEARQRSG